MKNQTLPNTHTIPSFGYYGGDCGSTRDDVFRSSALIAFTTSNRLVNVGHGGSFLFYFSLSPLFFVRFYPGKEKEQRFCNLNFFRLIMLWENLPLLGNVAQKCAVHLIPYVLLFSYFTGLTHHVSLSFTLLASFHSAWLRIPDISLFIFIVDFFLNCFPPFGNRMPMCQCVIVIDSSFDSYPFFLLIIRVFVLEHLTKHRKAFVASV